jgi:hypothetical protein
VANMLREKQNLYYEQPKEEGPVIRAFEKRLE